MNEKRKEQVRAVVYMIVLSAVFTALVSGVNTVMKDGIRVNELAKNARGILDSFGLISPDSGPEEIKALSEKMITAAEKDSVRYFRCTGENGSVQGYAFPLQGEGYWGPVYGFIAVKPSGDEIIGISITKHTETPGLGGRITEAWFKEQFKGKSLDPGKNLGVPLRLVQEGKKKNPQDVDSISGATGTSSGFEVILHNAYQTIKKTLKEH